MILMAAKNTFSTNLSPNLASALCYVPVVGFVAAIVLLIIEKFYGAMERDAVTHLRAVHDSSGYDFRSNFDLGFGHPASKRGGIGHLFGIGG